MSDYQTLAVPFVNRGNRQVIERRVLCENPWLEDFVRRFPKCFEPDHYTACLVFYPEGDAPTGI